MPEESFFDQLRDWSQWKHRILDRYLKGFAGILGSKHKTLFYVDGFAGSGTYGDGEPGSPVIAATLAAELAAQGRYRLHCINIEPNMFDELAAATAEFGPSLVRNRRGTLSENLPAVMNMIEGHPALFFLDPFGHVGMEWEVMRQIVNRAATAPTDVLLRFSPSSVDRHGMGRLNSGAADAAAHVIGVDALFGTTDWRSIAEEHKDSKEHRWNEYVNLYERNLAGAFARAKAKKGMAGDGVAGDYPVRDSSGDIQYYLISGAAHPKGGLNMSRTVYSVSEEYDEHRTKVRKQREDAIGQGFLFPEEEPTSAELFAEIVQRLKLSIEALWPAFPKFTIDQLEIRLLEQWFGQAVEKHYRAACQELYAEGKALVHRPPGSPEVRKGRPIPVRIPKKEFPGDLVELLPPK